MKLPIYMDNHATTPVDPRVLEVMIPCLTSTFGNAASQSHSFGWEAEKRVEKARAQAAALIGANPEEIIFTSGATESNNIALKGILEIYGKEGGHIITQVTEHKSVLDPCRYLERENIQVTYLGVDTTGRIRIEELKKAITDKTILISIMAASNEIGTIQPIAEVGKIAKEKKIFFHVDAAQAAGKLPIRVKPMGIDLLSFSSHKMYGPKGVGVLYVRSQNPRVRIAPLLHGGGQERGLRSGTLNVPGIVGLGKACEIAAKEITEEARRVAALRDRLQKGLEENLEGLSLNGHPAERLPNNLNVSFAGVGGESLMTALSEVVALSSGSACTSRSPEPSYVLKALGLGPERVNTSIRFGLGRFNTEEEVDFLIGKIVAAAKGLRQVSPLYAASKPENRSRHQEQGGK